MCAASVAEVFNPGGNPRVDLVAGDEGTPVVVLGCEGDPTCLAGGASAPPRTHHRRA